VIRLLLTSTKFGIYPETTATVLQHGVKHISISVAARQRSKGSMSFRGQKIPKPRSQSQGRS